jgi:hypothetical protein
MMQKHPIALRHCRRAADDVDDGDHLWVGAGQAIDGRELTDAKGGNESRYLVDTGISIGSVRCEVPSRLGGARRRQLKGVKERHWPALSSLTLPTQFRFALGR